jgi:hypothetical protein
MADSSINDPEAGPAAGEEKPPPREPPAGPPRPPRPAAKRASGSLRIPLPSAVVPGSKLNGSVRPSVTSSAPPSTPRTLNVNLPPANDSVAAMDDAGTEAATSIATPVPAAARISTRPPPAVVTPAVPGDKSTNYEFALTRRSSGAPPLAFDSEEVDPSDRAPAAPFTPWRDVPVLGAAEVASPPVKADDDHEDTIVGEVPKNLLELSGEDEDNTRAYQAPQELIDLARREREERRQAAQQRKRSSDSLLPAGRLSGVAPTAEEADQGELSTATVPLVDGAPPVALSGPVRSSAGSVQALRASGSGASLAELARAVSEPSGAERETFGGEGPASDGSSFAAYSSPLLTRGRVGMLLVVVFMAVGYALARWRGLDLLLPR